MIHPGDEGPKRQEENLFKLSKLTSKTDLETVMEQTPELLAEDSDDEGKKHSWDLQVHGGYFVDFWKKLDR